MIDRSDSPEPTLDDLRRSLRGHLEGLESWGVSRIFGEPIAPAPPEPISRPVEDPRETPPSPGEVRTPDPVESPRPKEPLVASGSPSEALAAIASEVSGCTLCGLAKTRNKTVPGVGDPRAPLMFVGEAPGADEDRQGEPFVGRAGQLLDKIIGALGFRREEVFIANTLKCRPPNNRDPLPDESGACTPYLERQVRAIAPRQIVALGRPAARFLTGRDEALGRLRGGKHEFLGVPVVVTYHPAYLLRNPAAKADCWHDLQAVVREFPDRAPPRK